MKKITRSIKELYNVILDEKEDGSLDVNLRSQQLRQIVKKEARVTAIKDLEPKRGNKAADSLWIQLTLLSKLSKLLCPVFEELRSRRILFSGQCYSYPMTLAKALRKLDWEAIVYNWDSNPDNQIYYHGEDILIGKDFPDDSSATLNFFLESVYRYDVFHFSNAHGISFGTKLDFEIEQRMSPHFHIYLLKSLGKKIVYSNNGCMDGVAQSSFAEWGDEPACDDCIWKNQPVVCSDDRNLKWGKFRNSVADFQCLYGLGRDDFNNDPRVHQVPEFCSLDPNFWHPDIEVPKEFYLLKASDETVRIYHAVGNLAERTTVEGRNIKSSHIILPLCDELRDEGFDIELVNPTGISNQDIRFLQVQVDIAVEMLTFGWFGANARELLMMAKPVVCFIRPEWLEAIGEELPEFVDDLPIVSATPTTVKSVVIDLINNPEKRKEIGLRGRHFALKWHSAAVAGKRFDAIYRALLRDEPWSRNSV